MAAHARSTPHKNIFAFVPQKSSHNIVVYAGRHRTASIRVDIFATRRLYSATISKLLQSRNYLSIITKDVIVELIKCYSHQSVLILLYIM